MLPDQLGIDIGIVLLNHVYKLRYRLFHTHFQLPPQTSTYHIYLTLDAIVLRSCTLNICGRGLELYYTLGTINVLGLPYRSVKAA